MTDIQVSEGLAVLARIARAFERIADALEQPMVPAPTVTPGCQHHEKYRVVLGAADEWECAEVRGGCGYRTPALMASGG